MGAAQAKKLGEKYILLNLIGTGGMAEVYRSVLLGEQGFKKLIVIKKLLPQLVQDQEMIRLFIGEARLAALLQHENIAATYDFGEIKGDYFLAMEYLAGKDLYTMMRRARETKRAPGPKHALMIASKICEAMEYAHNLKDLQNNPLNIIHRDLTPHNIFITYDGKVKVIDFGVAKAEMFDNRTKADVVKGKISYMSPEQMSGEVVDARSDIFSIGILLYEMISKKRMYTGDTATLIKKCITVDYNHLETILTDQPPELYALLHKALANDLDSRYQSCAEMQVDIDDLLFNMSVRPSPRALQNTIRNLFADEYEADQKLTTRTLENLPDQKLIDAQYDTPQNTTVHYDTLKGSGRRKSFLPAIFSNHSVHTAWYVLIAASTLLSLVIFLLPGWLEDDDTAAVPPHVYIEPEASPPPATLQTPAPSLSRTTFQEDAAIKDLLLEAEQAVIDDRLIQPKDDCALKYFNETLRLAPDNDIARDGLLHIGNRFIEQADKALSEQNFSKAEEYIKTGLTAVPGHQGLQSLKTETEAKKEAAIDVLAGKAKQCLAVNKITSPPDDSAVFYYNEILKIAPNNPLAREGLLKIGDQYAVIADKALGEMNFSAAETAIETGLSITPDHEGLLNLQGGGQEKRAAAIHELTQKVKQCLATNKLTTPANDCAFFYYTKILKIDPNNALARKGSRRIGNQYARMTHRALKEQNLSKAKQYIDTGLSISPAHKQLQSLKEELEGNKRTSIIHELAEKAQQCYDSEKLTTPEDDSAFFYYKEILQIDPNSQLAQEGFTKIADRYAVIAGWSFRQFDFKRTRKFVKSGLKVVPDHAGLLTLQADLNRGKPGLFFMSVDKNMKALFAR